MKFPLEGSAFIELIGLLKAVGLAETGGHAKQMVDEGLVKVNGAVESRKRAKLKAGDVIQIGREKISIVE